MQNVLSVDFKRRHAPPEPICQCQRGLAPNKRSHRADLVKKFGCVLVKAAECVQLMPDDQRKARLMGHHLPDTHMLRRMFASKPMPFSPAEVCERLHTIRKSGVAKTAFSWAGL